MNKNKKQKMNSERLLSNSVSDKTEKNISDKEFQDLLEDVRDFVGEMHHTASVSANLNEHQISDEWATKVKEAYEKPIETTFNAYKSLRQNIVELLQSVFEDFLKSKYDLIDRIFLLNKNSLHYAIIMKEESFEAEAEIIEFKMDYDSTQFSSSFPLIISFVDSDDIKGANYFKELDFEGESESAL